MANRGNFSQGGGPPGDLMIRVSVKPHPVWKREGYDILGDVDITVPLAVLGGTIQIETLDGPVGIRIPAGTNSGDK